MIDSSVRRLIESYERGAISRRGFIGSLLALGVSTSLAFELLASCGSTSSSSGAAGSSSAATPAGTPDLNATINMAYSEEDWTVNGTGVKSTTFAYQLNMNVYEPLIYLGSDYTLKPGLAESWDFIQPGTWRFHLRQGVKFHDGSPFSADDVIWTWGTRQQQGKTLGTVANTLGPNSVVKVDDYTVDFIPVTPNFRVPQQIVHPEGAIVPKGKNFDSTPPVGSGPFKVVSFTPGQSAVFERNDDYWGTKAMVKTINLRFLPDNQTRVQALQSGQVDFIIGLPPLSVSAVQSDSRFKVVQSKFGRNQLVYIDQDGKAPHTIGADPAVRQAVSVSIDRATYVKTVFDNNADPGRWMAPDSVLGQYAQSVAAVPFDQGRANQVLDAAGWSKDASSGMRSKNGVQLSLDLIGWAEVTSVAFQFLQSQLQAVGIQANIKAAADTPTYNNYYKNTQFDLDLEVPNQNDGNPAFLPILRMYSKNPGTGHFAPGGEFDTLAAGTFTTTDVSAVQQAAAQMMDLLINKDYIVVPLAGERRIFGMKSNVNLGDPHPSLTNQVWTSLAVYKS